MLEYKVNVIEELNRRGINTTIARKTGIFSQSTMQKFKAGDTSITLEVLNKLCCVLRMQPEDILEYKDTETDANIIAKISEYI